MVVEAAGGFDQAERVDLVAGGFIEGVGGVEEEFAGVGLRLGEKERWEQQKGQAHKLGQKL
jgi:hypothetical protein